MSRSGHGTSRRTLWLAGAVLLAIGVAGILDGGKVGNLLRLTATGGVVALIACLVPCALALVLGARLFRGQSKEPPKSC